MQPRPYTNNEQIGRHEQEQDKDGHEKTNEYISEQGLPPPPPPPH